MDVRCAQHIAPVVEHNGTVPVWWLVSPRELHDVTRGGFTGTRQRMGSRRRRKVDAHAHPTHEFYYILAGRGIMEIDDEQREVALGDLVHIPPDAVHSIWPVSVHAPLRGIAFAIGIDGTASVDYTHH